MTNAFLGLNDIQKLSGDGEDEENYGRCESPVLSKIYHRSQHSTKEMTPDDPDLLGSAREALTPLLATPQPLTGHDPAAAVPVGLPAVNPSFSVDTNLMPCTAKIPESLCDLLNFENTSWTSSLATPHGQNVTYSNLNTEEKKVLVSSKPVPRTLFTPEVKGEQSQNNLSESLMECSEVLHSVKPKKLCKAYKEFCTSEILSSNDTLQNTTVLTGIEKYSDISLACSTSAKEPYLVREVLDLLVSPVTVSRQKTCLKSDPLSETPLHNGNHKHVHELGKLSKFRPKAKRLFRKGNKMYPDRKSDTTVNEDQNKSDTDDGPTANMSKELSKSPNLSGTFIFESPVSPVIKAKADEKQQKDGVTFFSPVLHKTQEFLHDFSFSTLEEVCQASEVLASGCCSPVENCEISDNFVSQKREPCRSQSVSPIEFENISSNSSRMVVNKTSTPIHSERNKKVCANKKKIKFLNVHKGQKYDPSVSGFQEKLDFLCKPQVPSQTSNRAEQFTKYEKDLQQCNSTLINNCVECDNVIPDKTESLRHRVVSVKSSLKQNKKFAYISKLGTCNTVNITKFPSVDTVLSNMLQSAEALEAINCFQNENISTSLKKDLEQISRKETDFLPFSEWNLTPAGQQSAVGNFANTYNSLKKCNTSEEESKGNSDNAFHKTLGNNTIANGRKRKSGSRGTLGDESIAKRTCIEEVKSMQVANVFKKPVSNNLQPFVSDTQLNVVFDNVEAIVAEFNNKSDILGTVGRACNTQNLSSLHTENKCPSSLLENINALPGENCVDEENISAEENDLNDGKNRIELFNMDKNEINLLQNPIELKTQSHCSLKRNRPDSETSIESSRNLDKKLKKELDASENISLDRGYTKTNRLIKRPEVKQKIPKICQFNYHEIEEIGSEEPAAEEYNETSFLKSHQHIFDSSFTAATQKTTELFGKKEQMKGEALLRCKQKNSVECKITDETEKESSLIGSARYLLKNMTEDSVEHACYTEYNKREPGHFSIKSESNSISENESSHQESHMGNMTQVFQKKYDMVISPTICNAGSHSSKIHVDSNSLNDNSKEMCKISAFNYGKHCEKIPSSDEFLQTQTTVTLSSVDNGEKGLCAQNDTLNIKVLDTSDYGVSFTTAKGKKIEMSKECLDVACNLFRDIIEPNIEQTDGQVMCTTPQKGLIETITIREGNKTKHKVSVNNDTKNCKGNGVKSDNSELEASRIKSVNVVNSSDTLSVPLQVGFSTASGKKFTIPEKSVQKARHMFQNMMELEATGDDTLLKDYDVFGVANTNTVSSSNRNWTNFQRCSVVPEKAMHITRQFQRKVENAADSSSSGETLQYFKKREFVRVNNTVSSEFPRDVCDVADSHLSMLQMQLDGTKKQSVKFKINSSTSNVTDDKQEEGNILAQVSESSESLLEIDSIPADKTELDVTSKTVESGFITAAGGRLFILEKGVHKARKIFSDIESQFSSESKDCNSSIERSTESAYEGDNEPKYIMSTDVKSPLQKSSSHKTMKALLGTQGNNNLLNSECDTTCNVAGSMLENTKTKFESTYMTCAESDATLSKSLKVEASTKYPDNCHRIQTEDASAEFYKGLDSESNLNRGFMTAAGKNITVSATSLDRAKSMLSDISVMNEDDCKNIIVQVRRRDLKDSPIYEEKNKCNVLSKQHIKKALTEHKEERKRGRKVSLMVRNLSESLNKLTVPETVGQTDLGAEKCSEDISAVPVQAFKSYFSCGFQTAASKPLEISLASLNEAEEMFHDVMDTVAEEHNHTAVAQRKKENELFKKSQQNAETILPLVERNISVHDESVKTLDTMYVAERKLGTNVSPEKIDTFNFAAASGRDVEIPQLSAQKVKNTLKAPSNFVPKEANRITTDDICATFSDKVEKALLNETILIEQTSNIQSEKEIKTFDNEENFVQCKRLKMCGGFFTAGGKKVDVSDESLKKVRNLFSDITENVEETTFTVGNMEEKETVGESASKGQDVIFHGKVQNLSQDKDMEIEKIYETKSKNEVQILDKKESSVDCKSLYICGGFLTAGGKKVDVTEESLKRVRTLFSDITEDVEETTLTVENLKAKQAIEMYTDKGRDRVSSGKVRKSSQERAMKITKISDTESENEVQILDKEKNPVNFKKLSVCGGFSTASGKKINVSEESLSRVTNVFSDITENENNTFTVGNMKVKEAHEAYSSKKKDMMSVEKGKKLSLNKNVTTRKISDREFENEVNLLDTEESSTNCKRLNICGGFVTAGGKKVSVSEESLVRVKNLFSDITENVEETALTLMIVKGKEATEKYSVKKKDAVCLEKVKNSSPDMCTGTMKKSETEFENEVNPLNEEKNSVNCKRLNACSGFVTAGGKKVEVSEESLVRVRNLFSELTDNALENKLTVEHVKGKETTGNQSLKKKGALSHEIVKKRLSDRTTGSKKISDSESENEVRLFDKKQNVIGSERMKMYGGFVTGCGKKVEVSEESLMKVRTLFADITDNEENSSLVSRNVDSSPSYINKACITNFDCLQNEFVGMETHLQSAYRKPTATSSKETVISVLDRKNYISGTSNKPHGNAFAENMLQHNVKVNVANKLRIQKHETTLTQEVSESTAALLLDDDFKKELEESDSSCFSVLTERSCSPDLSVTMGSTTSTDREPGSPVIGSRNKCNRSNKVLVRKNTSAKRAESVTASVKKVCDQSQSEDKKNNIPPFIPEINGRQKRCSSVKNNELHKMHCKSNTNLNENAGLENDREPPAAKIKASIVPSPGSWLQLRMTSQKRCVKWRDFSGGNAPSQFTESELLQFGVKKSVINVTSKTAEFFKFSAHDFYREEDCQTLQATDDTSLEFDLDGFAGVQEVERAFVTSPNVDKSLIPAGWIQNHYRWIVWKLAATERSFPHIFASRYLTPRVLLLQLKYRYDREIDRCQRSALRRIVEHDDAPGKRMVLCVADVIKHEAAQEENGKEGNRQCLKMCNYELELTDGWYSIGCTVDMEMCHLIEAGRVAVGTKLVTHSAELVNCEQPCSPLEAGPNVRLKIHTNSTRRARWDCRLGFCRQPGPLPVSLSSLKPAGGVISCVSAVIARVYPVVYMEKGPDGKAEFYSAKQEALRASKRERQWQEHIEKLYSQERAQLSQIEWFSACSQQSKSKGKNKQHVTTPTRQQLASATSAEDLCQLLFNAPDPASLQSLLTEEQQNAVANYQQMRHQQLLQELESRVRKRIEEERSVTSSLALLKVRCLDAKDCSARSAVLSIWRPSEDLLTLFQEGSVLKIFSITANGLRNGDLQLSACRQSRYQPQPSHLPEDFPARYATPLSQVSSGNLHAPFGEMDCVGVVVHVAPLSGNYQTVYLADADMDIVGISFWNGLKGSGWEDILQQKALVACSNLQSRVGAAVHWIPTTYATEFSIFSQHPRQKHLIAALDSLRSNLNMDIDNFSYTCEGIVLSFLNENFVTPVRNASLNVRQTKPSTAELSQLSKPAVTPELSEKVQRRLFKLEQYGEPPSLSPLALTPRSRVLKKNFHVPLKTDQTAELSCDDSPPMSLDSDGT
ncbi:breast cancer type 2 susceptibility protein homolog [Schistocerca gregaria]|uniref:breast cancer type 2 susceptibility protein homolog n=1 Tax=Schistocerca gregaria TaxID=7010 RepID=UPI00211EDE34|nr:breast cancer type 2 susceptibility protein homolog [Schistocerca gregaria]